MRPVLFEIGPLTVRSYDAMTALGIAMALTLTTRRSRQARLSGIQVLVGALVVFVAGIVGARAFYVLTDLGYYLAHPGQILSLYGSGIQGGLLAGGATLALLARLGPLSFWEMGDLIAPGVVLGQAIGRVGCLLNGCCHGRETNSWLGLYLPAYGGDWAYRYPTQLIHAGANLLIFLILMRVERHKPYDGFILLLYAILFSAQRLAIDFLRDSGPAFGGTSAALVVSPAAILIAGLLMAWLGVRKQSTEVSNG